MGFDIEYWKNEIAEKLPGWQEHVIVTGYDTAYYMLAAVALLPVVQAVQHGDNRAESTLAVLLGNTGKTNLLLSLVSHLVDKSIVEIAQILQTETVKMPGMKTEIDVLLKKLEVIQQAELVLPEKQKHWFKEIIQQEQAILNTLDKMQFCHIPSGNFFMGEKNGELDLPEYWIGRYLVTNAQYDDFVEAGGYENPLYWAEAREAGVWQDGGVTGRWDKEPRQKPKKYVSSFNSVRHLLVGVTWYEMLAFTRWLGETWQRKGILPENWQVNLPSEAEWEKAARGGFELHETVIQTVDALATNSEQEIGSLATSALESYLETNSPYGVMEMNSNVWEWTRSIWKEYPYQPNDGREDLKSGANRVLRGGAMYEDGIYQGCMYREGGNPGYWYFYVGFRVVVIPVS